MEKSGKNSKEDLIGWKLTINTLRLIKSKNKKLATIKRIYLLQEECKNGFHSFQRKSAYPHSYRLIFLVICLNIKSVF